MTISVSLSWKSGRLHSYQNRRAVCGFSFMLFALASRYEPVVPQCSSGALSYQQHVAFMHFHNIAHLDISLRNIVTNYNGSYAFIDYEMSRQFDNASNPRVLAVRG